MAQTNGENGKAQIRGETENAAPDPGTVISETGTGQIDSLLMPEPISSGKN